MTLNELIERLEEYREDLGGDVEIRLMTQQNWPFENEIARLASAEEIFAASDPEDDDEDEDQDADEVIYICEGRQLGYGNSRAWDAAH